ncbi:MAG TPA: DUF1292 domain-containing protein [Candidatus Melainabacteria bacterium]|nr:DUF1292 domain-containing protein [Candidatus Melainabacteria bacterium]
MSNESAQQQEEVIITLEGEDGSAYTCQILDAIDFENNRYVILLKLKDDNAPEGAEAAEEADDDDQSLVIMRLVEKDGQNIFRTIESDEEFEKVVDHLSEIARLSAGEDEDDDDGDSDDEG